ncbi:lipoyl domain-containing protein [Nocardioides sp. YIM 152588]|uniref:lipoyl domain-containing protein n=1 Tax=Nocardioides sp. YIM 152588 TaxID=3158259 RepID=UPI0032E4C30E
MSDVLFPELSKEEPGAVGVVATWFLRDGDRVRVDDVIAEVQVDKVAADVVATSAGTIRLVVEEGAEVRQGAVIATIG